ncbi:cyclin-like protein [Zopfochytrium polystomum]|nr:cyclin-like protein [Zopfochytrium polystomum]
MNESDNTKCTCETPDIVHMTHEGTSVCRKCGYVSEENAIVLEVTFTESGGGPAGVDGITVSKNSARAGHRGGYRSGGMDSRSITLENGYRRIRDIGNQLKLSEIHIDQALRFFNLAVVHNFTKGRRGNNVAAACLYIACRLEKTPHMLLDFSECLQTNVFVLGATFVKLVDTLKIADIPMVDPALYIPKFASKLEFQDGEVDKTSSVIHDAHKLVARMDRDWIVKGRAPGGICAASLFIAARMNGFQRSVRQIVQVVKICEQTLKRRLAEFSKTPSSNLTVDEFQVVNLEEAADPPSFTRNRELESGVKPTPKMKKEKKRKEKKDSKGSSESLKGKERAQAKKRKMVIEDSSEEVSEGESDADSESDVDYEEFERQLTAQVNNHLEVAQAMGYSIKDSEEDASLLGDDIEVPDAILTQEEHEFKKKVWEMMYADWMEAKKVQDAAKASRPAKKPRKKGNGRASSATPGDGESAPKRLLSRKINYDFVQDMLEENGVGGDGRAPSVTPSATS